MNLIDFHTMFDNILSYIFNSVSEMTECNEKVLLWIIFVAVPILRPMWATEDIILKGEIENSR